MRGKDYLLQIYLKRGRITPAYAGKSFPARIAHPDFRDHPRLCGEKTVSTCPRLADTGSPPPMRGKGCYQMKKKFISRITPAYAGKSRCHKKEARGSRDHPRLCGEKAKTEHLHLHQTGSPPPMRGKDDHRNGRF